MKYHNISENAFINFYSFQNKNISNFKIDLNILDQSMSEDLQVFNQQNRIKNRFVRRQRLVDNFVSDARNELDPDRVRVPVEVEVCHRSERLARLVDECSNGIVPEDRKRFQRRRIGSRNVVLFGMTFRRWNLKRFQIEDDVVRRQIAETTTKEECQVKFFLSIIYNCIYNYIYNRYL